MDVGVDLCEGKGDGWVKGWVYVANAAGEGGAADLPPFGGSSWSFWGGESSSELSTGSNKYWMTGEWA